MMDIYNSGNAKVREAIKEDINIISKNMREVDIAEVYASHHLTPVEALERSFNNSDICFTVEVDNKPKAMFGCVSMSTNNSIGCIWLLSTKDFCKISKVFLKRCRGHIKAMLNQYSILYNYVHEENSISIKWLIFCGAIFSKPEPYGAEGLNFIRFEFRRDNGR